MREILFRGKRADNGAWVYGYFLHEPQDEIAYIYALNTHPCGHTLIPFPVDPATVGQYTGLTANGKKIFEGDIVKHDFGVDQIGVQYATVEYSDKYTAFLINPLHDWMFCAKNDCEVIGNIHDNPELVKGAQE